MKIETKQLSAALKHLGRIVGRRTTMPILSCVQIGSSSTQLEICASNLDEYQTELLTCEGEPLEPVCVNFNQLANAIGGESVFLIKRGEHLSVEWSNNVIQLPIYTDDFPEKPTHKLSAETVSCPDLAMAIKAVSWTCHDGANEHALTGVHIVGKPKSLTAEASNRANIAKWQQGLISSDFEALVHSTFAANCVHLLERDGAKLSTCQQSIRIAHNGGEYICKQLDARFPNCEPLWKEKFDAAGTAKTAELKDIFERCNFFSDPLVTPLAIMSLDMLGGEVKFTGKSSGMSLKLTGKFTPTVFKLNAAGFRRILQQLETDEVQLLHAPGKIILQSGDLNVMVSQCTETAKK